MGIYPGTQTEAVAPVMAAAAFIGDVDAFAEQAARADAEVRGRGAVLVRVHHAGAQQRRAATRD